MVASSNTGRSALRQEAVTTDPSGARVIVSWTRPRAVMPAPSGYRRPWRRRSRITCLYWNLAKSAGERSEGIAGDDTDDGGLDTVGAGRGGAAGTATEGSGGT